MTPAELVAATDRLFAQSAGLRRDMGAAWSRIAARILADCKARGLSPLWYVQRCDTARLSFLQAICDDRPGEAERDALAAVGLAL